MLLSAFIGFLSAAGIYFLFHCARQALLNKLVFSEKLRIDALVSVYGKAPELEMAIKKLKLRGESGEIYLRLVDANEETLLLAEKLARRGDVKIIT